MLSLSDNPPVTYPEGVAVADLDGTWWVAHTKARQEKALAHDLLRMRISYFLPLVERVRIIRGRRFRPLIPLFASYAFVCGGEEERLRAFRGHRLAGTIAVSDQATLIRELTEIQKALKAGAPMAQCRLAGKGRRCRVTAGPFAGIEGVVTRENGPGRLVLAVRSVGQAVYLDIEADLLEPADE